MEIKTIVLKIALPQVMEPFQCDTKVFDVDLMHMSEPLQILDHGSVVNQDNMVNGWMDSKSLETEAIVRNLL